MIDWIEFIPFAETRNYVQRVTENALVYAGREKK
jgi:soluble lytic murein transglycosylase